MTIPAPALSEPWSEARRQHQAMLFGLWIFLATEVLFFGGLFLFYFRARLVVVTGFEAAASASNPWFGTANTLVLLTSSLTMAMAERALRAGWRPFAKGCLVATVALGVTFLVVKGFEYHGDIVDHLVPGQDFRFTANGAIAFWSFYWAVTVVHAIHLSIGIGLVLRLLWLDRTRELESHWMAAELTAVYWHLVDVVWVVLYPLLYLVGRGGS